MLYELLLEACMCSQVCSPYIRQIRDFFTQLQEAEYGWSARWPQICSHFSKWILDERIDIESHQLVCAEKIPLRDSSRQRNAPGPIVHRYRTISIICLALRLMRLPILASNYTIEFTFCDCIVVSTSNVCIELSALYRSIIMRAINYISLSVHHSMQMNHFYGLGMTSEEHAPTKNKRETLKS